MSPATCFHEYLATWTEQPLSDTTVISVSTSLIEWYIACVHQGRFERVDFWAHIWVVWKKSRATLQKDRVTLSGPDFDLDFLGPQADSPGIGYTIREPERFSIKWHQPRSDSVRIKRVG